MKSARQLGYFVRSTMEERRISNSYICSLLNCSEIELNRFLEGRLFLSYKQIRTLAAALNLSIEELLNGGEEMYNENYTRNCGSFKNNDNREQILDIIDNYIDIVEHS